MPSGSWTLWLPLRLVTSSSWEADWEGSCGNLGSSPGPILRCHVSRSALLDQLKCGLCNHDLQCSIQTPNIRYVWKELKEKLGEDTDSKVKRMVFLKGKQGVCFYIPTTSVTEEQGKWHDSQWWKLSVATEQPELKGPQERYHNIRGQREGDWGFRRQREGNQGIWGQ